MIHGLLRTNVELFFPRTSFSTKKGLRNKTAWMSCRELIFKFILTVQILYTKWIYIFTGKCVENFGRCTRRNKGANFLTKMCFWLCQSFHWLKQFAMWPPRFDTDKDSFTEHISILWWWAIMGVTWFLTLLNNLANKDLLWRDSALPVKPCVELRGLLDDFWYWHCPNCFDSSRDVFVCQILLNLLGVQLCILDLRLLGRGMQVHWLMEGRKMRNPRYSNYMIKCPCAEKNTWWFQGLYVEVCFAPSCLNSGPFCPKACT